MPAPRVPARIGLRRVGHLDAESGQLDTNDTAYAYTSTGWQPVAELTPAALAGPSWRAISASEAAADNGQLDGLGLLRRGDRSAEVRDRM